MKVAATTADMQSCTCFLEWFRPLVSLTIRIVIRLIIMLIPGNIIMGWYQKITANDYVLSSHEIAIHVVYFAFCKITANVLC